MKKTYLLFSKKALPFTLYMLATGLSSLLWLTLGADVYNFFGAASLVYSFLLFLVTDHFWVSVVGLVELLVLLITLIVGYIRVIRKQKYVLFLFSICNDILISIFSFVYKIVISNDTGIVFMFLGLIIRSAFCVYMIRYCQRLSNEKTMKAD